MTPAGEITKWVQQMDASLDVIHVDKPEKTIAPPAALVHMLEHRNYNIMPS